MEYIHLSTQEYPITIYDIKRNFPNTSFPADINVFNDCVGEFGYAVVSPTPSPIVDYTKNVSKGDPIETENGYQQTWVISNASQEEIAERTAQKASEIREERNILLLTSDWTQLSDAPVDSSAWATYRQELRDISSQTEFPWNVIWPTEPQ